MICTTLQHKSYEEILSILDDPWVELAEIRLDRCVLSDEEIEDLFGNSDVPLVATCRIAEAGAEEAERLLSPAPASPTSKSRPTPASANASGPSARNAAPNSSAPFTTSEARQTWRICSR